MADKQETTKKVKKVKKEKNEVKSYKNAILILISLVLFAYSGFVLLFPAILTATFNKQKFCESVYKTTALVTNIDQIEFKMTPTLDMIITARGWDSKHIDNQNAFKAKEISVVTNPMAIFTHDYNIKSIEFKGTQIWDQILPNGENKLDYVARCFSPKDFGIEKMSIKPSEAKFRGFTIIHERGQNSKEEYMRNKTYSLYEVKTFLMNKNLFNVVIK